VGCICNKDLYKNNLYWGYYPYPNYLLEKSVRDELARRTYKAMKEQFEIDLEEELQTKPRTYVYQGFVGVDPSY
jgi:hypothetical protein